MTDDLSIATSSDEADELEDEQRYRREWASIYCCIVDVESIVGELVNSETRPAIGSDWNEITQETRDALSLDIGRAIYRHLPAAAISQWASNICPESAPPFEDWLERKLRER